MSPFVGYWLKVSRFLCTNFDNMRRDEDGTENVKTVRKLYLLYN